MNDDSSRPVSAPEVPPITPEPDLDLLLHWEQRQSPTGWLTVLTASLLIHLLVFFTALRLPTFVVRHELPSRRVIVHKIPLYLPPDLLTQKAPNKQAVSKSIDLADLLSIPGQEARKASPKRSSKSFEIAKQVAAPKPVPVPPAPAPPQILPQTPAPEKPQSSAQTLPPSTTTTASATPPPAAVQKPQNMPFQNIDSDVPDNPNPSLRPPKINLRGDTSTPAPSRDGRRTVMSDDNPEDASPGAPGVLGNPGERHAAVELKSDPQGTDFKPYLTRILAIVRTNWKRVIPESARSGAMSGRTTVEFIITRDGQIPKMVTAASSGSDPLDRAAIAGLSMSNPLPPLPTDFKGYQVRLAFSFDYNMPLKR